MTNLTSCLNKRLALNIAHRATNFRDDHIGARVLVSLESHPSLNFIRDVRDDLNGVTQVFATAFFGNNFLIDLTRCDVGRLAEIHIQEAFVVANI